VVVESSGRAVARIVPSDTQPSEGIFAFAGRWKVAGRLGPEEIDEAIGQVIRR
jgi:antitoxin (DNA-binding transcriptional repressor) of toxin-antitoxin stability system